MSNFAEAAGKKDDRVIEVFDLPEELVDKDTHVKRSIGLVKLKMSEETMASEKAGSNQAKLAYNWARFALVEVDGRRLDKSVAEDETVLEHCDPAIRDLILQAYSEISSTKPQTAKKFLASRRQKL